MSVKSVVAEQNFIRHDILFSSDKMCIKIFFLEDIVKLKSY